MLPNYKLHIIKLCLTLIGHFRDRFSGKWACWFSLTSRQKAVKSTHISNLAAPHIWIKITSLERITPGQRKFSFWFPLMRTVRVDMHTCLTNMETKYAALIFEILERMMLRPPPPILWMCHQEHRWDSCAFRCLWYKQMIDLIVRIHTMQCLISQ